MTATEFNRHKTPSGGWSFRQPQTSWTAPTPIASTFVQTVQLIIKHRKANPAITAKNNLATNPEAVASELERYTRKRLGLPEEQTPVPFSDSPRSFAGRAGDAVGDSWVTRTRQIATGIATQKDWLGDGGVAVAPEESQRRASICSGCPLNNHKSDWLSTFTKPVASIIQKQIAERNEMKLATSLDEQLGVCDACGCPLKLKVHVPLEIIKRNMKEPEKAKLDERCWILEA